MHIHEKGINLLILLTARKIFDKLFLKIQVKTDTINTFFLLVNLHG